LREVVSIEDVLGVFVSESGDSEGKEKERVSTGTATASDSDLTLVVSSLIGADHAHDELSEPSGTIPFSFPDKPEAITASHPPDSAPVLSTPTLSPAPTTAPVVIGDTPTMGTYSAFYGPPDAWSKYAGSQSWQATRSVATYTASSYDMSMHAGEARPVRGFSREVVAGVCCGVACNVALCGAVYVGLRRYGKRMSRGVREGLGEKKVQ
jgi:hypothetical protein